MTDVVLKRRARPWPERKAVFVKLDRGAVYDDGEVLRWEESATLAKVLDASFECDIVYLVGGWDAASLPVTEWFGAVPYWWERVVYHRDPLIAVYKSDQGRKVTIYSTAQWFGSCDNASLCRAAYVRLRQLLQSTFDQGADLLGTPARTGLDLLERSLPRNKDGVPYEYPVLDAGTRDRFSHNIGQGRMEFLPPMVSSATDLYILDATWMYAACIRKLPAPPMQHDFEQEYAGYRPGIYRVRFAVPSDWSHIGLLPVWAGRPTWPADPGGVYESWACGEELKVAYDSGWSVAILERWLWADDRQPQADFTRHWAELLRMLRSACTDAREGKVAPLIRSAIRAIVIKAIGGFYRSGRTEQVETPLDRAEEVEPGAVLEVTPTVIRWMRSGAVPADLQQFQHPEYACLVWGRARARLARAALRLPRESIVALRNDALVVTVDPGWMDDGKPGTFRLKGHIKLADQGIPQDERAYRRLLKGVEHHG